MSKYKQKFVFTPEEDKGGQLEPMRFIQHDGTRKFNLTVTLADMERADPGMVRTCGVSLAVTAQKEDIFEQTGIKPSMCFTEENILRLVKERKKSTNMRGLPHVYNFAVPAILRRVVQQYDRSKNWRKFFDADGILRVTLNPYKKQDSHPQPAGVGAHPPGPKPGKKNHCNGRGARIRLRAAGHIPGRDTIIQGT